MSFTHPVIVEFQHCDPAGIVFYPRYFEMISATVERFFSDALGQSFAKMHLVDRVGVPMAKISVEFHAPSRLEDRLDFVLEVARLGRSSVTFRIRALAPDGPRLTAEAVLVNFDFTKGRSVSWSAEQRDGLASHLAPDPS